MDTDMTVVPVDDAGNRLHLSAEEISAVQAQVRQIQSQLELDETSFISDIPDIGLLSRPGQKIKKEYDTDSNVFEGTDGNDHESVPKADGNYQQGISKAGCSYQQNIWKSDQILQTTVPKLEGCERFPSLGPSPHFSSDISKSDCNPDDPYTKAGLISEHMPSMMLVCDVNDPDFDTGGEKMVTMSEERNMSLAGYVVSDDTRPSFHLYKCPTCFKTFTSAGYLAKHKQIHTADTFMCLECGKTFNLKGNLQKHMDTHSGKKHFKCEECGKEFLLKGNLKKHLLNHSGQKDYVCLVCQKRFVLKGNLQKHLATHIKPFDCEQCTESFSTQASLSRHVKSLHAEPSVYECHLCRKQFHYMRYLRQHMEMHQESVLYSCSSCEQQFKTSALLKAHERKTHTEPTEECETCGKKFLTKQDLKRHVEIHREDKPFRCEICGKCFLRKTALSKHLATHKDFECDRCDASFGSEESLHQHQSVPCGDNLICPICQQSFTRRANLKRHLQFHGGNRLFKCTICQQMFTRKESMKRHLMGHNNIKPHECDFCGKRFISAWNLKTHRFTHTGESPYKCTHCGKGFRSTWNRNIHMSTHTGHKAYTCRVCSTKCTTYTAMRRHFMRHYPHLLPQNVQMRNKKRKSTLRSVNASQYNRSSSGSNQTSSEKVNIKNWKMRSRRAEFSLPPIRKPNKCSVCGMGFWSTFMLQSHFAKHKSQASTSKSETVGVDSSKCFGSSEDEDKASERLRKSVKSDELDVEMQVMSEVLSLKKFSVKPRSLECHKADENSNRPDASDDPVAEVETDVQMQLTDSSLSGGGTSYRRREKTPHPVINPVVKSRETQINTTNDAAESGLRVTQQKIEENTKTSVVVSETKLTSKSIFAEADSAPSDDNIESTLKQTPQTQEVLDLSNINHVVRMSENVFHKSEGPTSSTSDRCLVAEKVTVNRKNIIFSAECYICAKEFENSRLLKRHMKIHKTGVGVKRL